MWGWGSETVLVFPFLMLGEPVVSSVLEEACELRQDVDPLALVASDPVLVAWRGM